MNKYILGCLLFLAFPLWGQQRAALDYKVEATALVGDGEFAPFWLTANRNGTSGVAHKQASLRAGVSYEQELKRSWRINAGLELVGGKNLVSDFWVHQAYADVSWRMLTLSIGSKERMGFPLEKNSRLTSGWLVDGPNARPIPQVRGEIKEYLAIPGTRDWVAFKGHIAYGWFTDGEWRRDFVDVNQMYVKNLLYHTKSIMFRLGNKERLPLELEFGLLMADQFGGKQYKKLADGSSELLKEFPRGLKAYWKAFWPQSADSDNPEIGEQMNIEGNMLGSWNFSLTGYARDWTIRAYYEHYFNDHSQMFWEYGRWKDGQIGLEITPPKNRWITSVVWEGFASKHQSGPYESMNEFPGLEYSGGDGSYTHGIYQGWQQYRFGIGYPIILGPLYNDDKSFVFKSDRIRANHIGLMGDPSEEWSWRVLSTFVWHWGTYQEPLDKARNQVSAMAEVSYKPRWAKGWSASVALGLDRGSYVMGKNTGGMFTLRKTGGFSL